MSNSDFFKDELINTGLNIGFFRRKTGMSQAQLAEKAGLSRGFISQIEAPNLSVPISLPTLFAIAKALDVPAYRLLMFEDSI